MLCVYEWMFLNASTFVCLFVSWRWHMQRAKFESEICSVNRYQPPNKMKTMSSGKTNRRIILFRSLSLGQWKTIEFFCVSFRGTIKSSWNTFENRFSFLLLLECCVLCKEVERSHQAFMCLYEWLETLKWIHVFELFFLFDFDLLCTT